MIYNLIHFVPSADKAAGHGPRQMESENPPDLCAFAPLHAASII